LSFQSLMVYSKAPCHRQRWECQRSAGTTVARHGEDYGWDLRAGSNAGEAGGTDGWLLKAGQIKSAKSSKLLDNWWTWSGSNRWPLPCHVTSATISYWWCSTYESAKPAKLALSALFAAKMLPNWNLGRSGCAVGGQLDW